jgi:hypothetical protein
MLNAFSQWFSRNPGRLVSLGLCLFFAGTVLMLGGAIAQMVSLPWALLPDSPLGFTASASLVCWGVWAMGSGLRQRRGEGEAARQPAHRRG